MHTLEKINIDKTNNLIELTVKWSENDEGHYMMRRCYTCYRNAAMTELINNGYTSDTITSDLLNGTICKNINENFKNELK